MCDASEEALVHYCERCSAVLHPSCMKDVLQQGRNQLQWNLRVRVDSEPSHAGDDEAPRIVFFPQPVDRLLRIRLYQVFTMISRWRHGWVGAMRFSIDEENDMDVRVQPYVISLHDHERQEYIERRQHQEEEAREGDRPGLSRTQTVHLDASTLTAPCDTAIKFERIPSLICIQCRLPRVLEEISREEQEEYAYGSSICVAQWALFVVHVLATMMLALYLHWWCYFTLGFGWAMFVLPVSTFCNTLAWTLVGGPLALLAPHVIERWQSTAIRQSVASKWTPQQLLVVSNRVREHAPNIALLHTLRLVVAPIEHFVLRAFTPVSYCALASCMQGLVCARAMWTGDLVRVGEQNVRVTLHNATTPHVECHSTDVLRTEKASSWLKRLLFWLSGMIAGLRGTGSFGGPSLRLLGLVHMLCDDSGYLWNIYAFMILFETCRVSMYTYAAWLWLPRTMPRMFSNPNATVVRRLPPISKEKHD